MLLKIQKTPGFMKNLGDFWYIGGNSVYLSLWLNIMYAPVFARVLPTCYRQVGFQVRVPSKKPKKPTPNGVGFFGTLEGTRTPDLLIRSQSLYPAELPAHTFSQRLNIIAHAF